MDKISTVDEVIDPTPNTRAMLIIEKVARRVSSVAVACVLGIAFANVLDIVLRNFFAKSLFGLNEINAYLVAIAAATCLPYGLHVGAALMIRVLESHVRPTLKLAMALISSLLVTVFFALVAWRVGDVAWNMARTGQTTIMTNIATAPFVFAMTLALAIAALVMLAKVARNEVMERMVKELVTRTSLIIGMYGASGTKNCHDDEHGEILEALRNMNSDIAASLMEQHLRHIERDVDLTSERRRQVDLIEILAGSANSSR